jgi:hypothetical protein
LLSFSYQIKNYAPNFNNKNFITEKTPLNRASSFPKIHPESPLGDNNYNKTTYGKSTVIDLRTTVSLKIKPRESLKHLCSGDFEVPNESIQNEEERRVTYKEENDKGSSFVASRNMSHRLSIFSTKREDINHQVLSSVRQGLLLPPFPDNSNTSFRPSLSSINQIIGNSESPEDSPERTTRMIDTNLNDSPNSKFENNS